MLDSSTLHQLEVYKRCLFEYNEVTNIYSKKSYDLLDTHILDSYNLSQLIAGSSIHVDLGSGSGLPGVIIAIATASQVICIESKKKKRIFLEYLKHALDLTNLTIFDGDLQLFSKIHRRPKITSFSAKAFAKPPKLLIYLSMFKKAQVSNDAICWVPISEAQAKILQKFDEIVSVTSPAGKEFLYFKIQMATFQSYKADLKNQYSL